jgi:redox-sensitive bicupin YhaK (pirin superfamily)
MKKLIHIQKNLGQHWVGDGFPVRTIFTYNDLAHQISPFLLMDYGGPTYFQPSKKRKGVEDHPHRGFETVTIVYEGEVEHRDSAGGGGVINKGDVQWMTAASGLVHEEMHGKEFSKNGGLFEMVQLWVNLPKKFKMAAPRYQGIKSAAIPVVELEYESGQVRVIAGEYQNRKGPAQTFSEINLWDVRIKKNSQVEFKFKKTHTTTVFVLSGEIKLQSGEVIKEAELAVFDNENETLKFQPNEDAKILILSGAPLNEPIVGQGPFVMNTEAEIKQAFVDYQNGLMGQIDAVVGSD